MRTVLLSLAAAAAAFAADPNSAIRLDQVGYLPGAPKLAMVVAQPAASSFSVRRVSDDQAVFTSSLAAPAYDSNSGDSVQIADFTNLIAPGRYYIDVEGVGRSYPFDIDSDVYRRAYYLAMRAFYGQRCGTAVDMGPEFPHHHAICHTDGAWHWSSGEPAGSRESSHGWHDAGDYGRYIVNSGISTGTLLWTWELYSDRIRNVSLNIPESGNGMPDILNEIKWNLDWMLTMQDPGDGGVWHKQTTERFADFVMPEADTAINYVIGTGAAPYKSSCATADFAAVMSIASRAYAPFDAAFAARAGDAAAHAWGWLQTYPNIIFKNPAGVNTGEYGDGDCSDERLWAAAELWRSTGGDAYRTYFLQNYRRFVSSLWAPGWGSVAPLGLWTYVLANRQDADAAAVQDIRNATVSKANEIVARINSNGYRIALSGGDFYWGSNSVAANFSLLLMIANHISPDVRYRDAALENLHYLLGRNTFSTSWVTAVGSNWFKHPHHRPSDSDGIDEPWPGMLSGGPNRGRDDRILQAMPNGLPPMRYWQDNWESYAGNEICINWNAPLVFVLAGNLPRRSDSGLSRAARVSQIEQLESAREAAAGRAPRPGAHERAAGR